MIVLLLSCDVVCYRVSTFVCVPLCCIVWCAWCVWIGCGCAGRPFWLGTLFVGGPCSCSRRVGGCRVAQWSEANMNMIVIHVRRDGDLPQRLATPGMGPTPPTKRQGVGKPYTCADCHPTAPARPLSPERRDLQARCGPIRPCAQGLGQGFRK
jgi:hypothetical protein